MDLLKYQADRLFAPAEGAESLLTAEMLTSLYPALEAARHETVETDPRQYADGKIPEAKQPLDSQFFSLPEDLLNEYEQQRDASVLGRVLQRAHDLSEQVDRVVVLGIGGSYMGARALMEACCDPYYNELSRADRGSRPRMYFEGNNVDNDATQALLRLLDQGSRQDGVEGEWGIVVISKSGGTAETAVAFRQFLAALEKDVSDSGRVAQRVIPVTGRDGKLYELAKALGCESPFLEVPDGVGGRFSVLSAVGLLPAALLGLDVVQLLKGAAAMNDHFRTADVEQNVVLQYAGIGHLMETRRNANLRVLSVWSKALESVGLWYDQLLAESLGKHEVGVTPLTVVNTRDLHSRAQQHQQGRRDKLITNLAVESWREDALAVGRSDRDQDQLNQYADKTLPDMMNAARQGTDEAYQNEGRPTADLFLPALNEHTLGQLFQMLMLATVVEGRLLGVNPYGQPGVEGYKQNMKRILSES